MAFNNTQLKMLNSAIDGTGAEWVYTTTDSMATCSAVDYFYGAGFLGLEIGDRIFIRVVNSVAAPATVSAADFRVVTAVDALTGDATAGLVLAEGQVMIGDTGSGGTAGIVPAPAAGDAAAGKFLKADGAWSTPNLGDAIQVGTRASVTTTTIPAAINAIRTSGYAVAGDGGDALYKRVVSEPSHAGKVQSADESWWEAIFGPEGVSVLAFGADPTGIASSAPAYYSAMAYAAAKKSDIVVFPSGRYKIDTACVAFSYITLCGVGYDTIIDIGSNDFVSISSAASDITIRDMFVTSTNPTPGNLISMSGSASDASNLVVARIKSTGIKSLIVAGATTNLTHAHFRDIYLSYCNGWYVDIIDGCNINSVLFDSCRFDQNGVGVGCYRAVGGALSTGGVKFVNCVFEGQMATSAVDIGGNCDGYHFYGCHFELNGVSTNNACDIRVGPGHGVVTIQGCAFAPPYAESVGFYNIKKDNGVVKLLLLGNSMCVPVQPNHYGVYGFFDTDNNVTVIGTRYKRLAGALAQSPRSGGKYATYINDNDDMVYGCISTPVIANVATTNATPARIWGGQYILSAPSSSYDVNVALIGINATGDVYYRAETSYLITVDGAYNATVRGNIADTPITSGGTLAHDLVITGSGHDYAGFDVNVTGISATTITWFAKIKILSISF
jgi:hypothetical protein